MAVDLQIGSIQTLVTAADPDLAGNPQFIARVAEAVRAQLEAERRVDDQRAADAATRVKRRL